MDLNGAAKHYQRTIEIWVAETTPDQTQKLLPFIGKMPACTAQKVVENAIEYGLVDDLRGEQATQDITNLCVRMGPNQSRASLLSSLDKVPGIQADEIVGTIMNDSKLLQSMYDNMSDKDFEFFLTEGYIAQALGRGVCPQNTMVASKMVRIARDNKLAEAACEAAMQVASRALSNALSDDRIDEARQLVTAVRWTTKEIVSGKRPELGKFAHDLFFSSDIKDSLLIKAMKAPDILSDMMIMYHVMHSYRDQIGLPAVEGQQNSSMFVLDSDPVLSDDFNPLLFEALLVPMSYLNYNDEAHASFDENSLRNIITTTAHLACIFDDEKEIKQYLGQFKDVNPHEVFQLHSDIVHSNQTPNPKVWKQFLLENGMDALRLIKDHGAQLATQCSELANITIDELASHRMSAKLETAEKMASASRTFNRGQVRKISPKI